MLRALKRLFGRGTADPRQLALPLDSAFPRLAPPLASPSPPPTTAPAALGGSSQTSERRSGRRSATEEDAAAAIRLSARHAEFNAERFDGALRPIRIEVSRRLRSRLGYYRVATPRYPGLIVISRRHLRRHGWAAVFDTLLHEMVHQWQDESGLSVDHGPQFRAKARLVGTLPRARRPVG